MKIARQNYPKSGFNNDSKDDKNPENICIKDAQVTIKSELKITDDVNNYWKSTL